jgi:nucleotide sugar dehydrogenase
MESYQKELLFQKKKIGVWGVGYIGFSTMAHYAANDVIALGYDVDDTRVRAVNRGEIYIPGLQYWLGFETEPLVKNGLLRATTDYAELLSSDVVVHFICIPTERAGKPYWNYLKDVLQKIAEIKKAKRHSRPPLLIIESTLTPGTTDKIILPTLKHSGIRVGKDVLLGVAPRRDWFVNRDKSLRDLDRVFGGFDSKSTKEVAGVLSIVCAKLHAASDYRVAEMIKSIENAYRHMEITLANQLTLAYPDVDMREALRLVGTKWNIGTYEPSFGTGGYCIPLSSQYVIEGAKRKHELSLLESTIRTDRSMPKRVAESIKRRGLKRVGILGLSYRGNLKVQILSPAIGIVAQLKCLGIAAQVYDPYFTAEEVKRFADAESFDFPDDLKLFDCLLVVADLSGDERVTR